MNKSRVYGPADEVAERKAAEDFFKKVESRPGYKFKPPTLAEAPHLNKVDFKGLSGENDG